MRNNRVPSVAPSKGKGSFKGFLFLLVGFVIVAGVGTGFSEHYFANNDNWVTRILNFDVANVNGRVDYVMALQEDNMFLNYDLTTLQGEHELINQVLEQYKESNLTLSEQIKARTILDYDKIPDRPRYIIEVMFREWERLGGTHDYVPYAIAGYESRFNPLTRNLGNPVGAENSWGLYQVNVGHPAHAGRMGNKDFARLYEPVFNMQYQFPELIRYEKEGIAKGLTGTALTNYVARYGQRPTWTKNIEITIAKYHAEFLSARIITQ